MTKDSQHKVSRPLRRALEELLEHLVAVQPTVINAKIAVRLTHYAQHAHPIPFSRYSGMVRICSNPLRESTIESSFDNGATYYLNFVPQHIYRDEQDLSKGYVTIKGKMCGAHFPEQYCLHIELQPRVADPLHTAKKSAARRSKK